MLYERWRMVAEARGGETALWEADTGRTWSFRELERAAEAVVLPNEGMVYPRTGSAAFVIETLAAWRRGRTVCPLEAGQPQPCVPSPPDGLVHLKLTSATTGTSRCVAFTGAQLAADADVIRSTMGLRPDWPNLGVISLAHSYGFSNLVLPLLLQGIPLVLAGAALPEAVRRAARLVSDLTLPAVPALWRAWQEAGAIPANTRLALSAGAPLPTAVEAAIYAANRLKVHNFYGASECGGIAYDRSDLPRVDPQLVGTAMDGVEALLGEGGVMTVRGPAVGSTYWPEPDARLRAGVYRTEDLAEIAAGQIYLRGRSGDLIHVAGRKVAPETVERVLREHPSVRDCLVLGLPGSDAVRVDEVAAVVEAEDGVRPEQLQDFLLERGIEDWQVPRAWRFVASLQPGARGKVSRAHWRERLRS